MCYENHAPFCNRVCVINMTNLSPRVTKWNAELLYIKWYCNSCMDSTFQIIVFWIDPFIWLIYWSNFSYMYVYYTTLSNCIFRVYGWSSKAITKKYMYAKRYISSKDTSQINATTACLLFFTQSCIYMYPALVSVGLTIYLRQCIAQI